MTRIFFINLLIPTTISTTDVCFRLSEIQPQFVAMDSDVGRPFCNADDICIGVEADDKPIPCQEAFVRLTRHNERAPLEAPPMLMPPQRYREEVIMDFEQRMHDKDLSHDLHELDLMNPKFTRYLDGLEEVVGRIAKRTRQMFPRIFYDPRVDGPLFNALRIGTDFFKRIIDASPPADGLMLIKHIHRSFWIREWSVDIRSIVRYVAQQSLQDMELVLASIAPTLHAYLYLCSNLEICYKVETDWSWIITAISKYDPLYIADPDVIWTVPPISAKDVPVSIQLGPEIDWSHFQDIVWNSDLSVDDPSLSAGRFFDSIKQLFRLFCLLEAGDFDDEDLADQFNDQQLLVFRLAYTLKYLGRETDYAEQLDAETMEAVTALVAGNDRFDLDRFTWTTLLRLTRSQLSADSIWKTMRSATLTLRSCDQLKPFNITYVGKGPKMLEFFRGILSVDQYRLSQSNLIEWNVKVDPADPRPLPSREDLHRDLLAGFFNSSAFARTKTHTGELVYSFNPSFRNDNALHVALGRLIGICLSSPSLRSLLKPYLTRRPEQTSLFQTIFFSSYWVRRGVYDVVPYGMLETVFSDVTALVEALSSSL